MNFEDIDVMAALAVAKGANFLDIVKPDWRDEIIVDEIEISSLEWCILGQLYDGDYCAGLDDLFGQSTHDKGTHAGDFGFDAPHRVYVNGPVNGVEYSLDSLTHEWRKLLSSK